MISRNQLKNFIEKYQEYEKIADDFLDSLPVSISACFFDNPITDAKYKQNDLILNSWLGTILYEEVIWFFYDWTPINFNEITIEGKKYIIKSLDDFLDYLTERKLITI